MHHFSLGSQNSEYPRIFQVTGANQNARKLLSTDLVNTNGSYCKEDHEKVYKFMYCSNMTIIKKSLHLANTEPT